MSNILETFFFIFDSDATRLDKGLSNSDRQVDKLDKNLKEVDATGGMVGKTMLDLATKVGGVIGSFLAFSALKTETLRIADFADQLNDSAEAIGVNVEALHAWDNAAKLTGGTTGGFIASLKGFNEGINSIAIKGKGLMLPFFEELGLGLADIKAGAKDPIELLSKLSDSFAKLDVNQASAIGSKIGLDQGTINLLRQGRLGLEELIRIQRENGVVTEEQAEAAAKFNDELDSLSFAWEDLKRRLILGVVPALTTVIEATIKVVNWIKENRVAVVTFFGAVAAALVGVYTPAVIAAAAATWALLAPFLAVAIPLAAFAAGLALVTDDLYNFMKGNDSVTGEIAKKWPIVGHLIRNAGDNMAWFVALMEATTGLIADFFTDPENAIENFRKKIDMLVKDVTTKWPMAGAVFKFVTNDMSDAIAFLASVWDTFVYGVTKGIELFKQGIAIAKGAHGAIGEFFGAEPTDTAKSGRAALARGQGLLSQTNSPIASQSSSAVSNSSRTSTKTTQVQIDKVEVQTQATDGAAVGQAVSNGLASQIKGAIDQNDDGVAA